VRRIDNRNAAPWVAASGSGRAIDIAMPRPVTGGSVVANGMSMTEQRIGGGQVREVISRERAV
jgi:hypothetical protein